jgi:hypothetical protein
MILFSLLKLSLYVWQVFYVGSITSSNASSYPLVSMVIAFCSGHHDQGINVILPLKLIICCMISWRFFASCLRSIKYSFGSYFKYPDGTLLHTEEIFSRVLNQRSSFTINVNVDWIRSNFLISSPIILLRLSVLSAFTFAIIS